MNLTVLTYCIYLSLSIGFTFWIGKVLSRNGESLLFDIFEGNGKLADQVNKLMLLGFHLLNIGYITLNMGVSEHITSVAMLMERLSVKLGLFLLLTAVLHFVNLIILAKTRKNIRDKRKLYTV